MKTTIDLDNLTPRQRWFLDAVSGTALVIASAWFFYTIGEVHQVETVPRIVNSISIEPTILLPGKVFHARINVTLNKLCPYEVHWSLIRKSDGVETVKIVEPVKQPPAALGTQDLPPSDRYVPGSTAPGDYQYASDVYDICPDGHTYIAVRKSVDITIR